MKYYKITNKEEKHNGLQYQDGLIVDPVPFNPTGNCETGGIYFASEDIFAFLDYGPWLREVTLPADVQVYENPGEPTKWKADKVFLGSRREINAQVIKKLIEEGANVHAGNDYALRYASENGHTQVVKLLLEHGANVHVYDDYALREASECGHTDIVKLLLEHGANVHADNNYALRHASKNRHTDIVKLLLKHSANVHARDDFALCYASKNGHTKVVALLKQYSRLAR